MTSDLQNLADHVKARRADKDWTQLDVYNQGGPSNSTLTAVEDARTPEPSRSTLRKLDAGLQWEPGSAKAALAGEAPAALGDALRRDVENAPENSPRLRAASDEEVLREVARRFARDGTQKIPRSGGTAIRRTDDQSET